MRLLVGWSWLALAVAGCRVGGVEAIPLRGAAPEKVAIWPTVDAPFSPRGRELLESLAPALRQRGHQLVSPAVAEQLLAEAGQLDADIAVAAATLRVDAVLRLEVREFVADVGRPLRAAEWDLTWRLWSARGHELWAFQHRGRWRPDEGAGPDPLRPAEAELRVVPIGGERSPAFRDAVELLAWLHRMAMEHLPRAPA